MLADAYTDKLGCLSFTFARKPWEVFSPQPLRVECFYVVTPPAETSRDYLFLIQSSDRRNWPRALFVDERLHQQKTFCIRAIDSRFGNRDFPFLYQDRNTPINSSDSAHWWSLVSCRMWLYHMTARRSLIGLENLPVSMWSNCSMTYWDYIQNMFSPKVWETFWLFR